MRNYFIVTIIQLRTEVFETATECVISIKKLPDIINKGKKRENLAEQIQKVLSFV